MARRLATAGVPQRLLVRDPRRAPQLAGAEIAPIPHGYESSAQLREALTGFDTLFLVSASEAPGRWQLHVNAVDAALDAGVTKIVYLSFISAAPECTFTFGRDHWKTEAHIRERGVPFTFVRDNIYADFVPLFPGDDGVIRGPANGGRVAVVAQDDIADVVTRILIDGGHDGATYDVTGPRALTMAEIADELAAATGRPVQFVDETIEEAYASRARYEAPAWQVDGWVSTYTAIANGDMDRVTDTVANVAGHPATPLAEVLLMALSRR